MISDMRGSFTYRHFKTTIIHLNLLILTVAIVCTKRFHQASLNDVMHHDDKQWTSCLWTGQESFKTENRKQ